MTEPPKKSALRLLTEYEREARLLADETGQNLEAQLREDLQGTLALTEQGLVDEGASTTGPVPEARPLLRELAYEPGIGLCLSGFGYKAMLFHVGALIRLNEAGFLPRLERVSSVSAASIVAGALGLAWPRLEFDKAGVARRLAEEVVDPVRRLAGRTIDHPRGLGLARLVLQLEATQTVPEALRENLFGDATLQDLPDRPRFVIGATNLQSGALWRFSKPHMLDYRVGEVPNPKVAIAIAVAASAAYSVFLAPVRLQLDESDFAPDSGVDLQRPPFTSEVLLADGGIHDSLALESVWNRYRTVLVGDGGGLLRPDPGFKEHPFARLFAKSLRINEIATGQMRSVYKRQLVNSFTSGAREGAYWALSTIVENYALPDALPCPPERTRRLASLSLRLAGLPSEIQERLINWGYAVSDAAIRRHLDASLPPPDGFPYPRAGV